MSETKTPAPADHVNAVSDIEAKEVCAAITELLNSGNYKPDGGSYRTFRRARAVIERYLYPLREAQHVIWRWQFEAQGVWHTGPEVPPDVYHSEAIIPAPAPKVELPAQRSEAYANAEAAFHEYFLRNYPGPDTVIFDPRWHAPKLFAAAARALRQFAPASRVIDEFQVADPKNGQWRVANPDDVMGLVALGWPVRVFLENSTLWNLVEDERSIGRMPEPSPVAKVRRLNEVADVPTRQEAAPLEEQHQPGEGTTSTSALLQTSYPPERHPGDTEREPQAREDSSSCSPSEMASDNHTITAAESGVEG